MAFGRRSERHGGTPTGERVPLDARRARWRGGWTHALVGVPLPLFVVARMKRSVIRD